MALKIKKKKQDAERDNETNNLTEITNTQLEFYRIKEQKKLLEKREKDLKGRLDKYMSDNLKPDSKGHYLFSTKDEKGNNIHLQRQARKKIELNEERALSYLRDNGHEDAIETKNEIAEDVTQDQVLEVLEQHASHLLVEVTKPNEGVIEQKLTNEEIPMDEFEELCDVQVTYAMTFVKDKDIQQEKDKE